MNTVDPTGAWCQYADGTKQIGCLVQADQCSIGYAGESGEFAESISQDGLGYPVALLVEGRAPTDDNIRNSFYYPLASKVYFNSYIGFNAVWGAERDLAAYVAGPSGPALVDTWNFVTLGGRAYLEDFNDAAICGVAPNTNGCANNPFGIDPDATTTCGDGIVECGWGQHNPLSSLRRRTVE